MTLYDEWRKDFLFVDQQGFVKLGDRRMEEAFRAGMLSAADIAEDTYIGDDAWDIAAEIRLIANGD